MSYDGLGSIWSFVEDTEAELARVRQDNEDLKAENTFLRNETARLRALAGDAAKHEAVRQALTQVHGHSLPTDQVRKITAELEKRGWSLR